MVQRRRADGLTCPPGGHGIAVRCADVAILSATRTWRNGRRKGLKIPRGETPVPVRVRPSAPALLLERRPRLSAQRRVRCDAAEPIGSRADACGFVFLTSSCPANLGAMIFKSFRRPFDRVPAAAALALSLVATAAPAAGLAGAGGGAIYPLLSRWADQYAKETGDTINYQAVGSGGTILQQMESKTILFANTDIPLSPADVARNNLVQFPHRDHLDHAGRKLEGHQAGRTRVRRPDARQHLPRQRQGMGRSGDQEAQSGRQSPAPGDHHRSSLGRVWHHVQLHRLPLEGQRRMEVEGRRRRFDQLAERRRRQRQSGRRVTRAASGWRHRLCRVRLRDGIPPDLHQHDQQVGQNYCPDHGSLPGGRGQRRFHQGQGFLCRS